MACGCEALARCAAGCDDVPDGSVVDASVVLAQSGGMVLIGDQADIEVLARDALTVGVVSSAPPTSEIPASWYRSASSGPP